MNPIVQFSERSGHLVQYEVPGVLNTKPNPENEVYAADGAERKMYVYVPESGLPHPKQTQVLMIYQDSNDENDIVRTFQALGIAELSEKYNFIAVIPVPLCEGWVHDSLESEHSFVVRCFGSLKAKTGVSGFNGMIYHLATTDASSQFVWQLSQISPLDTSAIMLKGASSLINHAVIDTEVPQAIWFYSCEQELFDVLSATNKSNNITSLPSPETSIFNPTTQTINHVVRQDGLNKEELNLAWVSYLSRIRRWRNGEFGEYQERPNFSALGFVAHVDETSLEIEDGIPRTWYEYVPNNSQNDQPRPLVFYFHGINCCGLYAAEQSNWIHIAQKENLALVFPDATEEMRWNAWDDSRIPSDVTFVKRLIDYMSATYNIDTSRIYISGFSMGSMFTNALASAYPETFAGAIALNGPHASYLNNLDESVPGMLLFNKKSRLVSLPKSEEPYSPTHLLANRNLHDSVKIPFVQFVGLEDNVGFDGNNRFPVSSENPGQWTPTVSFWKVFNDITSEILFSDTASGFCSDGVEVLGNDGRFVHQFWNDSDSNPSLYHLIPVKGMPHAVDSRSIELGWKIVKGFSRNNDGSLTYTPPEDNS